MSIVVWVCLGLLCVGSALFVRKAVRDAQERADMRAMRERVAKAREQPPLEDKLGMFRCRGHYWTTELASGVRIGNYDPDPKNLRASLELRRAFLEETLADSTPLCRLAAEKLLSLYNDTWREGGAKLDVETMAKELSLRSIKVSPEPPWGPTVYLRAPGWMFGGHAIELVLEPDGRVRHASPTDDDY